MVSATHTHDEVESTRSTPNLEQRVESIEDMMAALIRSGERVDRQIERTQRQIDQTSRELAVF
jgi:chaperonin cofactor prefoldin